MKCLARILLVLLIMGAGVPSSLGQSTTIDSMLYDSLRKKVFEGFYNEVSSSKVYLDSMMVLSIHWKSANYLGRTYQGLGLYHRLMGNIDSSLHYLHQSLKTFPSDTDSLIIGTSLFNIGVMMSQKGDHEGSLEYYFKDLAIRQHNGNLVGVADEFNNIGIAYKELGQLDLAIEYFQQSIHVAKQANFDRGLVNAYGNLSGVLSDLNRLDSAKYYILKSLKLNQEIGDLTAQSFCNSQLAYLFQAAGQSDSSYHYASLAVSQAEQSDHTMHLVNALLIKGNSAQKIDRNKKAYESYRWVIKLLEDFKYMEGLQEVHYEMSQLEERNGNYRQSLMHFKLHSEYQDSIINEQTAKVTQELNLKYETAQKDAEITGQTLRISQQRNTRNILWGSLGIAALLLGIVLYRFKLNQKINAQNLALQVQENSNLKQKQKLLAIDYVIQGQEEERKRIAKDLHDGLGSLLLSAKLQLQNIHGQIKRFENMNLFDKAENLLTNAQNEVRRIAHNMMPEALINFGLPEAIEDLAHQINLSTDTKVITTFYSDFAGLANDKEIALFRIVQEGINNALKHAKAGTISLEFSEDDENYLLSIKDDGVGFDVSILTKGIGLKSLDSRVKYLNGEFYLESTPGQGTAIDVVVPKLA